MCLLTLRFLRVDYPSTRATRAGVHITIKFYVYSTKDLILHPFSSLTILRLWSRPQVKIADAAQELREMGFLGGIVFIGIFTLGQIIRIPGVIFLIIGNITYG